MAQLDASCTICECVGAPIDSIDGASFFFFSITFRDKLLPELDGF